MQSITKIFQTYISSKIPKKQTNIFFMLFNGVDAVFAQIEIILKIFKKERNILTANSIVSLRNLAAYNGFEPKLKTPSSGIISININPKLFNRVGYPLYLPPYAIITNIVTGLSYYHNSNTVTKIDNEKVLIPVVEGTMFSKTEISQGSFIERIYINSDNISEGSIVINIGEKIFTEVKSFFDNDGINDNKQFVVKFSNRPDNPIVIYIKGTKLNESINITYRLTSGELGNIEGKAAFTTQDLITAQGFNVEISEEEATITNVSGFNFGSNGTDENGLRSAIGFNHGVNLLFDSVSYTEYINKFSTLLLQNVIVSEFQKSINNIYLSKRQYINPNAAIVIEDQYKEIISFKKYNMTDVDKNELTTLISENEYALSSHNLFDARINNFAFQFLFNNEIEKQQNTFELRNLIYLEFSKFLYNRNHNINIELLISDFMTKNNVIFEYTIFNSNIESQKIANKTNINTPYIINTIDGFMPLLSGNFNICGDNNFNEIKLFFDINIASKTNIIN